MKIPENPPSRNILETVPQAVDPEHPLYEEFWQMVVNGGVMLSEDELSALLSALRVKDNKSETNSNLG